MSTPILHRLGKKPVRHDVRTLRLGDYIDETKFLGIPTEKIWSDKVDAWPMYLNDTLGDCTDASAGHMIQCWTANGQLQCVQVTDADILKAYERSGYVPGDPSTDQGAVEIDVLKGWRTDGIGGHKISAFMSFDPKNAKHMAAAIYWFGGAYLGLALPITAQQQDTWDVTPAGLRGDGKPGSWGGHAVPALDFFGDGSYTVITWGAKKKMTGPFTKAYCEEAYAILTEDFLTDDKAPNGLDIAALRADLAAL
jgi:hypothetical protein